MAKAQFDRDQVIENSLNLFWQHGFSASSMKQIVAATGLKPGSLYLAFGNKEGLFKETLNHYSTHSQNKVSHLLDEAKTIGDGLCELLDSIALESNKRDYCSCFLVKTQLELAADGGEQYKLATQKLYETEQMYRRYIAQEFGEQDSEKRATSLMLHIFGARVYGYQASSLSRLQQGLRQGLPWLPWKQ